VLIREQLYTYKDIVPACRKALQKLRRHPSREELDESALSTSSSSDDEETVDQPTPDDGEGPEELPLPRQRLSDLSDSSTAVEEGRCRDDEGTAPIPPHDHRPDRGREKGPRELTMYRHAADAGSESTCVEASVSSA
jgi:hypothetical protein